MRIGENEEQEMGKTAGRWRARAGWLLGWFVFIVAFLTITVTSTKDCIGDTKACIDEQLLVDFVGIAIMSNMAMLLFNAWKHTAWTRRAGWFLAALAVVPLVPLAYGQFVVQTIRVVGNSYGGLKKDLEKFNNPPFSLWKLKWPRRLHAELASDYNWFNTTTNERFDIAMRVLTGEIEADVIELDGIWLSSFIDRNRSLLKPLNGWYGYDTNFENRFWPKSLEVARAKCVDQDGKETHQCLYAIPLYVDVGLLLYRKDLLRLSDPIKLDNLLNLVKMKLEKENKAKTRDEEKYEGLVFQGARYEGLNCMFFELLAIEGQPISPFLEIDTPKANKVLGDMHSWIYKEKLVHRWTLKRHEEESRRLFFDGKALLLRNWPYVLWTWSDKNLITEDKVGVVRLEGGKPILGGWYLGIPSRAKHKDGAWRLISFLTNKEQMKARAQYKDEDSVYRRIPADKAVLTELKSEDLFKSENFFIGAIEDALNGDMTIRPRLMGYPLVSGDIAKVLHKVLIDPKADKQTIKNALSTVPEAFSEGPVKLEDKIYDEYTMYDEPPN